jgi:ABC-type multidrug transport system fused ATPase/permease subunit
MWLFIVVSDAGVNLSGGQKQRIALARAVYSDSPTLVMDDPFSAVDANVGEHIFQHCVRTELKHKTVLLITNQLHFLPRCDFVYVLNHGRIVASGTHAEIVASGFDFALLNEKQEIGHLADEHAVAAVDPAKVVVEEHVQVAKATESQPADAAPHAEAKKADAKPQSDTKQAAGETLVEEEDRVQGSIDLTSYIKLIHAMGGWPFVLGLSFTLIAGQFFLNIADFWLGAWAARVYDQPDSYYVMIHGLIALGAVVFLILKAFLLANGAAGSSRGLHEGLIQSVMRAPSRFFDATPTGRITNRFSKDMQDLDVSIPSSIDNLVAMIVMLLANMLTTVISVSPYFLLVMVAMMLVYSKIQQYYQRSVMQLNRFEATSRSPLYSFFMESVSGCVTIRASGKQRAFIDEMEQRCENNVTKFWMLRSVFFWSTLRIESCNAVLQVCTFSCFLYSTFEIITNNVPDCSSAPRCLWLARTVSSIRPMPVRR